MLVKCLAFLSSNRHNRAYSQLNAIGGTGVLHIEPESSAPTAGVLPVAEDFDSQMAIRSRMLF